MYLEKAEKFEQDEVLGYQEARQLIQKKERIDQE